MSRGVFAHVRALAVVASGWIFVAAGALLADEARWIELAANWFPPYVVVPLAGALLSGSRGWLVPALVGAGSACSLVVVFYGVTAAQSEHSLSLFGPVFWFLASLPVGAVTGLVARGLTARTARHRALVWGLLSSLVVVAEVASLIGPSAFTVIEQVVAIVVMTVYCSGVLAVAVRGRS